MKMMVGNNLNDVQLQQLVDRTIIKADEDLDGKISFDEFCKVSVCFMRTKCLDGQGPRCNRKANHSMLIQSLLNLISKSDNLILNNIATIFKPKLINILNQYSEYSVKIY